MYKKILSLVFAVIFICASVKTLSSNNIANNCPDVSVHDIIDYFEDLQC